MGFDFGSWTRDMNRRIDKMTPAYREEQLNRWYSDASQNRARRQRREDQLSKTAHKRAMELAKLNAAGNAMSAGMRNKGALDVADRRQIGETRRAGMNNTSKFNTESLKNKGLNFRQRNLLNQEQNQYNRTQNLNEFSTLNGLGKDGGSDIMGGGGVDGPGNTAKFRTYTGERSGIYISQDKMDAIGGDSKSTNVGGGNSRRLDSQRERKRPPAQVQGINKKKKPFGYDFLNSRAGYLSGAKSASVVANTVGSSIKMMGNDIGKSASSAYNWLSRPMFKER